MFERIKKARRQSQENGFTLIELLVVIAILGILAAIVVFSVAGVTDKGQYSSCKIDTQTLQTAEEANFAAPAPVGGSYVTMAQLQTNGFLSSVSTLHDVTVNPAGGPAKSYYIIEITGGPGAGTCGGAGHAVGNNVPSGATAPAGSLACGASASGPGAGGWGDC